MSYSVPRVLINEEFQQIPVFSDNPLAALIFGPQYNLNRYSVAAEKPSLADLRLVPLHVHRNGHHEIRLATQGLAIGAFFGLRSGHHPNVAVIIAHEFTLGIRSVPGRPENTD